MLRERIVLSREEELRFKRLGRPDSSETVWDFWRSVANKRGLAYTSINGFTALPIDHDKHWCWPSALKLNSRPAVDSKDVEFHKN